MGNSYGDVGVGSPLAGSVGWMFHMGGDEPTHWGGHELDSPYDDVGVESPRTGSVEMDSLCGSTGVKNSSESTGWGE